MKRIGVSTPNKKRAAWFASGLISLAILSGGLFWANGNRQSQVRTNQVSANQAPQKKIISVSGYDVQPDDFGPYIQSSSLVVEGTVKEIRMAVWTTPDGSPPSDDIQRHDPNIQLRTPVLISIDRTRKGQAAGDLLFSMIGGETADYKMIVEDKRSLTVGDKIIVFLDKASSENLTRPWVKVSPYYPVYYFISNGDKWVGTDKAIERTTLENQLLTAEEAK